MVRLTVDEAPWEPVTVSVRETGPGWDGALQEVERLEAEVKLPAAPVHAKVRASPGLASSAVACSACEALKAWAWKVRPLPAGSCPRMPPHWLSVRVSASCDEEMEKFSSLLSRVHSHA